MLSQPLHTSQYSTNKNGIFEIFPLLRGFLFLISASIFYLHHRSKISFFSLLIQFTLFFLSSQIHQSICLFSIHCWRQRTWMNFLLLLCGPWESCIYRHFCYFFITILLSLRSWTSLPILSIYTTLCCKSHFFCCALQLTYLLKIIHKWGSVTCDSIRTFLVVRYGSHTYGIRRLVFWEIDFLHHVKSLNL